LVFEVKILPGCWGGRHAFVGRWRYCFARLKKNLVEKRSLSPFAVRMWLFQALANNSFIISLIVSKLNCDLKETRCYKTDSGESKGLYQCKVTV